MRFLRTIPALPVRDTGRSVTFYCDTLGFVPVFAGQDFAIVRRDAAELHLWVAADETWRERGSVEPVQSGAESFLAGTGGCRIEVDGVDDLYKEILPTGALHQNGHIADKPHGAREFTVVDPDNNCVTFFAALR